MSGPLVFYTHPLSRGRIVRWMLEEVGAPYETEYLGYGAPMKVPAYRAINPMGKVPAIRHGETVVTECAAICAYLADAFPKAGLAPPPAERGPYYRWLFFAAGPLETAMLNTALGFRPEGRGQGMSGYGSLETVLATLEGVLPAEGFIAGDGFSAADLYLGAQLAWGLKTGMIEARPGLAAYAGRMTDRPAARRTNEIEDAAAADMDQPT